MKPLILVWIAITALVTAQTSVSPEVIVKVEDDASADAVIVRSASSLEVRQRLSPMVMAAIERPDGELRPAAMRGLTSTDRNRLARVVQALKAGNQAAGRREWQLFIRQSTAKSSGAPLDINALIQLVLRQSFVETNRDLQFHAAKVQHFNELKQTVREKLAEARKQNANLSRTNRTKSVQSRGDSTTYVRKLEQQLQTVGDDAQLANIDLQNMLQKQQQTMQMMSQVSKMLHDTAMAVVRKIGS